MTRLAVLGLILSPLLTSCMLTPTDDGTVANTTDPVPFSGYLLEGNGRVQVRAWDFNANAMANVGAEVRSSATATDYNGTPLFSWWASRTLASRFWTAGPAGGSCANVAAVQPASSGAPTNLITVEQDWGECLADNPTVAGFANNCASNHYSFASIYTTSWGAKTIEAWRLSAAALLARGRVDITFDNYQPDDYLFCNDSNPTGCPPGLTNDPETYKYYNPNASFIAVDDVRQAFSITPARADMMTVYIDDMQAVSFDINIVGGKFVLGINFEATGTEVRMDCIRNGWCLALGNPTIDFTAPRAVLTFDLAVTNDRIGYSAVTTTFTTGLTGDGRANDAANAIAAAITEKLTNDASIRTSVGEALDALIRGAGELTEFPTREVTAVGTGLRVLPGCPRN